MTMQATQVIGRLEESIGIRSLAAPLHRAACTRTLNLAIHKHCLSRLATGGAMAGVCATFSIGNSTAIVAQDFVGILVRGADVLLRLNARLIWVNSFPTFFFANLCGPLPCHLLVKEQTRSATESAHDTARGSAAEMATALECKIKRM